MPLERDQLATVTRGTADARYGITVRLVRRERHNGVWFWDCLHDSGGPYLHQMLIPEDALEAKRG